MAETQKYQIMRFAHLATDKVSHESLSAYAQEWHEFCFYRVTDEGTNGIFSLISALHWSLDSVSERAWLWYHTACWRQPFLRLTCIKKKTIIIIKNEYKRCSKNRTSSVRMLCWVQIEFIATMSDDITETSRGHVSRKRLQLLNNVNLMSEGGLLLACMGTPPGQLHSKWPPAGLRRGGRHEDSGRSWLCLSDVNAEMFIQTVEAR